MALDPCRAARSHFSDHLDGEPLSLGARLLVRMHLTICPPCRRYHRSLAATRDALRDLRDADPTSDDAGSMGGPGGSGNRSSDL